MSDYSGYTEYDVCFDEFILTFTYVCFGKIIDLHNANVNEKVLIIESNTIIEKKEWEQEYFEKKDLILFLEKNKSKYKLFEELIEKIKSKPDNIDLFLQEDITDEDEYECAQYTKYIKVL